jgi:hypothetical protein
MQQHPPRVHPGASASQPLGLSSRTPLPSLSSRAPLRLSLGAQADALLAGAQHLTPAAVEEEQGRCGGAPWHVGEAGAASSVTDSTPAARTTRCRSDRHGWSSSRPARRRRRRSSTTLLPSLRRRDRSRRRASSKGEEGAGERQRVDRQGRRTMGLGAMATDEVPPGQIRGDDGDEVPPDKIRGDGGGEVSPGHIGVTTAARSLPEGRGAPAVANRDLRPSARPKTRSSRCGLPAADYPSPPPPLDSQQPREPTALGDVQWVA